MCLRQLQREAALVEAKPGSVLERLAMLKDVKRQSGADTRILPRASGIGAGPAAKPEGGRGA